MIQGKETDNLCVSRRSVAFEACKQLHKIGALSDNLMPFNKRKCIDTYRDVYFQSWSDPRFADGMFQKISSPTKFYDKQKYFSFHR